MCGIAGIIRTRGVTTEQELRRMNDEIVHRGPDDDGYFCEGGAGIAMRRLSIIDLAGGHQPLSNEDGSKWIVFNGEIYNYRDLRRDLEGGHQFRTHSDTETIVHAFEQFGPECVQRFNGMFAFAIWDRAKRKLFAARDRLGVKPFYYYWDGSTLMFASEIKSILAAGAPKILDEQSVWNYLSFRYVSAPNTMWQGIRKLPPGYRLELDADSRTLIVERYWDMHFDRPAPATSEAAALETFGALFEDAVRLRLIADVPVGIFLSGGLDSSAVSAAVSEVHNARLDTFSVAFKSGGEFSELRYAREVAEYYKTNHHEIEIDRDEFADFLPEFGWYTDEPLADPASIPLFYVSRLARERVKVVLSGEGADEVLAGYTLDADAAYWDKLARFQRIPRAVRVTVGELALASTGRRDWVDRLRRRNVPVERQNITYLPYMTGYFSEAEKRALWPSMNGRSMADSNDLVRDYFARSRSREPLDQRLYAYCQDWLVEDLLMKADKMTMATSIELRVPFLDYRLVEWLASQPPSLKVHRDASGRYVTKYLLRRYCEHRLPRSILERPKQGFPVPITPWMNGWLGQLARDRILAPDSWSRATFDEKVLRGIVDIPAPSPPQAQRIWVLLVLELWARRWM
jgi:asparagine synthase (glutamine-hydrolysing)